VQDVPTVRPSTRQDHDVVTPFSEAPGEDLAEVAAPPCEYQLHDLSPLVAEFPII